MKTLHLLITGRVQGVGFRDWLVREATQLQLSGWVRNVGADTVETVLSGEDDAVDACVQRCWQGPSSAHVSQVRVTQTAPPDGPGFIRNSSIPAPR